MPTVPGIPDSSVDLKALPSNPRVPMPVIAQDPYSGITAAVNKYRDMADATRVAEATNELEKQRIDLTADYSKQLGANVLPKDGQTFTDRYVGQLKDAAGSIAMNLTPRQQFLFNQQAQVMGTQFQEAVQRHETTQLFNNAVDQHKSTVELALQDAPNSYQDPAALGNLQGRIDGALENLKQLQGMDDTSYKLAVAKAHDEFSAAVIGKFIDQKDYAGARDYYMRHLDQMQPATAQKIDDILKKRENLAAMTDTVTKVWKDQSLNYEQKGDALREAFKDDPDMQKAAIEGLHERLGEYKQSQDQSYGKVWDMITGLNPNVAHQNLKQIESSPEWLSLDGDQRKTFISNYRLWIRQLTETTTPQEDYNRCVTFNDYVMHPQQLLGLDDNAMMKVAPTVGKVYFDQLMDLRSKLRQGQQALANVDLDPQRLKIAATNLGYDTGKKMSPAQAQGLASFTHQAILEAQAAQMRLGRKLSDDEQQKILDRLSADTVVQRQGIWSYAPDWLGRKTEPLYRALDDLPFDQSKVEEARRWLLSQGLEVTPDNVTRTITKVFTDPAYRKVN